MTELKNHVDTVRQFVSELLASGQYSVYDISMIVGLDIDTIQEIYNELFISSEDETLIQNEIVDDFIDR